MLPKLLTEYI